MDPLTTTDVSMYDAEDRKEVAALRDEHTPEECHLTVEVPSQRRDHIGYGEVTS